MSVITFKLLRRRRHKLLGKGRLEIGCPKTIRVDGGPEFILRDLDLWAYHKGVVLDFTRPGTPTGNDFIECFNRKLRQECLNARRHCCSDQSRNTDSFLSFAVVAERLEPLRK